MNKKAVLRLRAAAQGSLPFPEGDPRNPAHFRRLKRVYSTLPRPDRDPSRLAAALVRAMKERYL